MKIKYTGPFSKRIVGPYQWNQGDKQVQEVTDPQTVVDLLTNPLGDFEIDENDPLLKQVGREEAERLALEGTITPLKQKPKKKE